MAVHVLAVLAYKEGDRVTSALLAGSVNTNPVIIRRLLLSLQKAKLVETCKGAGSGSRLSRSPRRINLGGDLSGGRGRGTFCHAGAKTQARPVRWATAFVKLGPGFSPPPKVRWNETWKKPPWPT